MMPSQRRLSSITFLRVMRGWRGAGGIGGSEARRAWRGPSAAGPRGEAREGRFRGTTRALALGSYLSMLRSAEAGWQVGRAARSTAGLAAKYLSQSGFQDGQAFLQLG